MMAISVLWDQLMFNASGYVAWVMLSTKREMIVPLNITNEHLPGNILCIPETHNKTKNKLRGS
jgi:hypothetical protein